MKAALLVPPLLLCACATLPDAPGPAPSLPGAVAGPFRALVSDGQVVEPDGTIQDPASEIGNSRSAPNGFDDGNLWGRDIAVVDADGDPATLEVFAYVAAAVRAGGMAPAPTDPTRTITRYGAVDGRSFDWSGDVVLQPDAAWEGNVLASPAALRVGGEIFLYYAAAGGIGLAKSADGLAFVKVPGPALAPQATGWEQGAAPASPGVVALADGTFRMFYEVATAPGVTSIGEARSDDGASWSRLGDAPALAPVGVGDAGDAGDEPWDSTSVGSPFPILATSADGRTEVRVYYGALDSQGHATVGLAARYGTDGPLSRAVSAVFGTSKPLNPREPCVVAFAGFTFLYATEASSTTDTSPVIAVGVAPATVVLPAPVPK